jgi:GTP-binding protein HflX
MQTQKSQMFFPNKGWTSGMIPLPVLLLLLLLLQESQNTFAFTIPSKSLVNSYRSSSSSSSSSRGVSTVPEKNEEAANGNPDDMDMDEPKSLFDIDSTDNNDASLFQVKDMSSFQEVENDNDEDDDDSIMDMNIIDVEYDLEYDDDDLYSTNIEDMDTSIYTPESMGQSTHEDFDSFTRDTDDILEEREDRLYVNELGEESVREKCILIGVENLSAKRKERMSLQSNNPEEWEVYFDLDQSMDEMKELITTGGLELAGVITQRLNEVNPKTYIGTGKVKEAQELLEEVDSCTVVFDGELSPGQQKALENAFNKEVIQNDFLGSERATVKVVDRTALILDIFAQHAKTREGKLQVDLALHEYRKPRLTKMWTHLERQSGAGGVGLRGPGESQLEIDKRLIRDRIIVLKRKIDSVQKQRNIHRKGRSNLGLPVLALVGYTNSGKSTLLNYLTRAGVMAESMLFATLDPTTRKVKLPGLKTHPEVLLTDTVGFIQKLPTQLVAAFRATLEEVKEADVLVHVIDASNPVCQKQEMAVNRVLSEIGAGDKPIVRVLNKIDKLDDDIAEDLQYEAAMMDDYSVAISSITGEGMTDLVSTIEDAMMGLLVPIEVVLPYTHGKEVNMVQEVGHVEEIEYRDDGTYLLARVPEAVANRLKRFSLDEDDIADLKEDDGEIDWVAIGRGRHEKKQTM